MSAVIASQETPRLGRVAPIETTLLELVQVLNELTDDDREIVATVFALLDEGRVRLTGNFAGHRLQLD